HAIIVHPLKQPELFCLDQLRPSRYLHQRPGGFAMIRWLQFDNVSLFVAVDAPYERIAMKKLKGFSSKLRSAPLQLPSPRARDKISAEIAISSLRDVLVKRQLPLDVPVTPFPQLLDFQYHGPGDATLLYKFYNGGTLYDVIMSRKRARRKVPEGFIWHVIAQLFRALCYLHTGHFPLPGRAGEAAPQNPNWVPICHWDGHESNVWLHSPSADEMAQDPNLRGCSVEFPQVILGDFGGAFEVDHEEASDMLCKPVSTEMPELATWRDKACFGRNIKHLIFASDPDVQLYGLGQFKYRRVDKEPRGNFHALSGYSDELIDVVAKFEPLIEILESYSNFGIEMGRTDRSDWPKFPSNEFLYGATIARADYHVARY
ncbi:hypothetical protein B0T24DRAFT_497782, partial [Lasiosphaeria ovina]